ncbi:MAG: winged helix-turn-helix domain-containing protein [SAR202 cluster bacterium]|nr:winged helix-turn-helix domain-containing protein [SAR202 cluster bacterium]MDP6513346.1 winged helix-turn-helix domain-containing protein [SAR202 cluster bacterium]MDP6713609.1 winged helix-turn-helix domain-containing protein [SAR202 cluster bacterium]
MTNGHNSHSDSDAYLKDLNGSHAGRLTTICEDEIPIGRQPGLDGLTVEGDFLDCSRVHAKIIRQGDHLFIKDIGTLGGGTPFGTAINGRTIEPLVKHQLVNNVIIRLGRIGGKQFRFVNPVTGTVGQTYTSEDIQVDTDQNYVRIKGEELNPPLPPLQTRVLKILHDRNGQAISRQILWSEAWDNSERVMVYGPVNKAVQRLNIRLKDEMGLKDYPIKPVRGIGYRLMLDDQG